MEIVAILRMGDANTYYHLKPIADCLSVKKVWILRPRQPTHLREIPKSIYREIRGKFLLIRLWRMFREAVNLCRRSEVGLIVSFNAVPYGLLALLAGLLCHKPVHIGFMGHDWYIHCKSWYGKLPNIILRRANFMTVCGNSMAKEMTKAAFRGNKVFYLPHAIDTERFAWNYGENDKIYDCIFVGELIKRKRVELIIKAISLTKLKHPGIQLCIVGDGPLKVQLEKQVVKLKLQNNVSFAGYQPDPLSWILKSKMMIIASEHEGMPFALIEGICVGVVPVAAKVGTVSDFIEDGKTGLLFKKGDSIQLADRIIKLIEDGQLSKEIRKNLFILREEYCFEKTSQLWDEWLIKFAIQ